MPVSTLPRWTLMACLFLVAFGAHTQRTLAGCIRHDDLDGNPSNDPDDYLYRQLAENYPSVGAVSPPGYELGRGGSGTLISPDLVLTAAHVAEVGLGLPAYRTRFLLGGQTYTAKEILIHPGWTGDTGDGYDIALIRLSAAVLEITPSPTYTAADELGRAATIVGFGRFGTGEDGWGGYETGGHKRAGRNVVDNFGSTYSFLGVTWPDELLVADFDSNETDLVNRMGSSTPLMLEYLTAPGDSGGPWFLDVNGVPHVAGVTSFGVDPGFPGDFAEEGKYNEIDFATRVSAYTNWIQANRPLTLYALSMGSPLPGYSAYKLTLAGERTTAIQGRFDGPMNQVWLPTGEATPTLDNATLLGADIDKDSHLLFFDDELISVWPVGENGPGTGSYIANSDGSNSFALGIRADHETDPRDIAWLVIPDGQQVQVQLLVTSVENPQERWIEFGPIPEPATLCLLALGGLSALRGCRRGRS